MQTRHPLLTRTICLLGMLAALSCAAFAVTNGTQETIVRASFSDPPKDPIQVYVLTGQSVVVKFDQKIGRVAVSNLDFAEAVLVSPTQLVINGKASGRARFTTWSKDDEQMVFIDVDVRVNLAQIDSQVRTLFPKEDIRLSQANGSVVISGSADPKVAQQVEQVVQAAGFKTVNLLAQPVQDTAQVQLFVRVAEVSRNKLAEYAFSPAYQSSPGTGGYSNAGKAPYTVNQVAQGNIIGSVASSLNLFVMGGNAFAFLRALQQNGALRALAEPNLIAMNGQTASFLAGGEIPVPIVQGGNGNNNVTVQWKEYGVRVNFKPQIIDEQHIKLELEPEVSSLDYANAIEISGFSVPALRVRRAKTGIELQDGQSFGIAGLLDNSETKSMGKLPIIADVPILGNLFKSKSFQRNETELVFIVTAKITKPMNPDAVPRFKEVDDLRKGSPLGIETPKADDSSSDTSKPAAEVTPAPASKLEPVTKPANATEAPKNSDATEAPASPERSAKFGGTRDQLKPVAQPIKVPLNFALMPAMSPALPQFHFALTPFLPSMNFAIKRLQWSLPLPANDFKFGLGPSIASQLETKPE